MCPVFSSSSSPIFLIRSLSFLLLIFLLCTALFVMSVFQSCFLTDLLVPFFSDVSCYASVFVLSASHTGFLQLRPAAAAPMLTPLPEKIFAVAGRRPATRLCFSLSRSG